jgi:hypothetical protein
MREAVAERQQQRRQQRLRMQSFAPKNVKRREKRRQEQIDIMAARLQAQAVLLSVKDKMAIKAAEANRALAARAEAAEAALARAEGDVERLAAEVDEPPATTIEFREEGSGYRTYESELRLMIMQLVHVRHAAHACGTAVRN